MASEVYNVEEILLSDGTEVELRPLPIARLRKFMRMWTEHIANVQKRLREQADQSEEEQDLMQSDLNDEQYDVFMKMCALGLEQQLRGEKTTKQFMEYLEETLDEPTVHKILHVTGGLKLTGDDDPNQNSQPSPLEAGRI